MEVVNQWEFSVASLHCTSNTLDVRYTVPSMFHNKNSKFLRLAVHPSIWDRLFAGNLNSLTFW